MSSTEGLSTQLVDGPNARFVLDGAEVRIVAGPDKGVTVELGTDSLIVGSSSQCDLVLHDKTVSSRHAELQVTSRGYFIRDLGSTNGLLYGSQPIDRAPLRDGMRLSLGETSLLVRALGKQVSVPLARSGDFAGVTTRSVKMRALVAMLEQIAISDATVLIEGETGTGKEHVAAALHATSTRRAGPFVVFDCATLSPELAAAELFGHEKGAFTGADVARPGLFAAANGGTLFIDEVGELPLALQPLLLRALESKHSRRVGAAVDRAHDVRIVAATNRNLAEEVRGKGFRKDLFFRLTVTRLKLPPLRERLEDLPVLADRFAREAGGRITPEMISPLEAYHWPGNVRELKNTVTRMVVQSQSAREALADDRARSPRLFGEDGQLRPWLEARRLAALEIERDYLKELLALAEGNLSHAAELAGVTRQALSAMAQKHGLHPRR
jgi:DNA-binding NtrC family response regulator